MTSALQDATARYYDENTPAFLRLGGSHDAAAIHRRIWAPGIDNQTDAFLFLNRLVAEAIRPQFSISAGEHAALDLGCGVGGTTTWISNALHIPVTGVSNSRIQVQIAKERARRLGQESRVRFILADFLEMPELGLFRAAWAIESFVHAADPLRFFSQAAACLHHGARLVICDDFLAEFSIKTQSDSRSRLRWLEQFRKGWHISNLLTIDQAIAFAELAGFHQIESRDLTPWLHNLHPLMLNFLSRFTLLPLPFSYWQNLAGGSALQVCQKNGWIKYHALILEKS